MDGHSKFEILYNHIYEYASGKLFAKGAIYLFKLLYNNEHYVICLFSQLLHASKYNLLIKVFTFVLAMTVKNVNNHYRYNGSM